MKSCAQITTPLPGVFVLSMPVSSDFRGCFEVFWEHEHVAFQRISFRPTNAHHSHNSKAGTIRAFHYQDSPHAQAKLVTCVSGRIWDVVVDLREDSPTYLHCTTIELVAGSGTSVYIPAGCAHGFATLVDNATIAYLIEGKYEPSAARVLRWDDPVIGVPWPVSNPILSDRDKNAPLWTSTRLQP